MEILIDKNLVLSCINEISYILKKEDSDLYIGNFR